MSRSRRKTNIVKDKGNTLYNRVFRRVNKQRVKTEKDPLPMNEVVEKYDVCDYIFFSTDKKYLRK